MNGFFKMFGAGAIAAIILNSVLVGLLVFGVVKACDYVESGKAVEHIKEIQR